jgi:hypothetical protein
MISEVDVLLLINLTGLSSIPSIFPLGEAALKIFDAVLVVGVFDVDIFRLAIGLIGKSIGSLPTKAVDV